MFIQNCGCKQETEGSIRMVHSCRKHWIAVGVLGMLHTFGGHEECCDLPSIRKDMEEGGYTKEEILAAADEMSPKTRDYVYSLEKDL